MDEQRAERRKVAWRRLNDAKLEFDTRNQGAHIIVHTIDGTIIDFWPGTDRWQVRGEAFKPTHHGIENLIIYARDVAC